MSDRLGPLRKFLRSQCGRKWNDVYSDVCQYADNRSIRGYHLRDHIDGYVERYPDSSRYGIRAIFRNDFYVDKDGILRIRD